VRVKLLKKAKDIKIKIEKNPDDFKNYLELGRIYLELYDLVKAKKAFETLFSLSDISIDTYLQVGDLYKERDKLNEAIEFYTKALELDNNYWKTYEKLTLYYVRKSNHKKAIESYEETKKLTDENFNYNTYICISHSYRYLELYKESISILEKAIELEPENSRAYRELAYLYEYYIKDRAEANEIYKKVIEFPTKDREDYREFAYICLNNLKDYDRAIEFYERVLELEIEEFDSDDEYFDTIYSEIIDVYMDYKKDYEKALQRCYEALEYFPFSYYLYIEIIKIFELLGKVEREEEIVDRVLKLDLDKAFYTNKELSIYYRRERKDFKRAILFLKNISKTQECSELYNCMGANYADLYEIDKAKECFFKAYKISKDCLSVLNIFEMNLMKNEPFYREDELIKTLKGSKNDYLIYQVLKTFQKIKNGSCENEFLELWNRKYRDSAVMFDWSFISIKEWIKEEKSQKIRERLLEAVEVLEYRE